MSEKCQKPTNGYHVFKDRQSVVASVEEVELRRSSPPA
jgi:hypothetical protein